MGSILSSCGERLSKFNCKSSCSITDGEKEIMRFKKTLSFDEIINIKAIIEHDRNLQKKIYLETTL